MKRSAYRKTGIAVLAAAAAASLALTGCSSGGDSESSGSGDSDITPVKIGIGQIVQHIALDETVQGFKEGMADAGYVEGETVEYDEQNANGEQSSAVTITQQFADSDLDLVFAVSTPLAQAAVQTITDKPILFATVTDPVAADIVPNLEEPGGMVSGTTNAITMDTLKKQFDLMMEIKPDTESVGLVYSSGEINSEVQAENVEELCEELGLELVVKTIASQQDIAQATEALGDVDAIYVPTDNALASSLGAMTQVAESKGIPMIAGDESLVKAGATATIGINYVELGRQTAEMAVKVLQDGVEPGELPVESADTLTYAVNPDQAERTGIEIPQNILDEANIVETE